MRRQQQHKMVHKQRKHKGKFCWDWHFPLPLALKIIKTEACLQTEKICRKREESLMMHCGACSGASPERQEDYDEEGKVQSRGLLWHWWARSGESSFFSPTIQPVLFKYHMVGSICKPTHTSSQELFTFLKDKSNTNMRSLGGNRQKERLQLLACSEILWLVCSYVYVEWIENEEVIFIICKKVF